MPRAEIEQPGLDDREKVRRLAVWLTECDNTAQLNWLTEIADALFGLSIDRFGPDNCDLLFDRAAAACVQGDWRPKFCAAADWRRSFLTNDFDDTLADFDTRLYVPCLRTDDLVFRLALPAVCERLERSSGIAITDPARWPWRSANCSSGSKATAPGPAPYRCPPIFPRGPDVGRGRSGVRRRLARWN